LIDHIQQKRDDFKDLIQEKITYGNYERLLQEIESTEGLNLEKDLVELPQCSIQANLYKPFQVQMQNPNFANPQAINSQDNALAHLMQSMMLNQHLINPNEVLGMDYLTNSQNHNNAVWQEAQAQLNADPLF
jgi:hypothetical protein